jgi:hypothetical protein
MITLIHAQTAETPVGDGSADNPYQIANLNHLYWLTRHPEFWDKHYIQTADIDAADTHNWNDEGTSEDIKEGCLSIGNSTTHFTGQYNGQSFIISNLFINRSNQCFIGFFGWINNCNLSNIRLQEVDITGQSPVGALIGIASFDVQVSNCNVSGSVRGMRSTGGLIGKAYGTNMTSSYSLAHIYAETNFGGLIGDNESSNTIMNCFYNYDWVMFNYRPKISLGALTNDLFNAWINNNLSLDINDYYTFDNSGRYLINNADNFKNLLYFGQLDQHFILNNDINLSSLNNLYIYEFKGIFDGNNHTMSHFTINDTLACYVGLFGNLKESEIKNLVLTDCNISAKWYVGGISAYAKNSSIMNCQVNLSINGMRDVGGIIGFADSTQVENCSVSGSVTSQENGGGIIGCLRDFSTIFQCSNSASVIGKKNIGGIVGTSSHSIKYCSNTANITALDFETNIGGIAGSASGGISHCQNSGILNGGSKLGGICGSSSADFSFCTNISNLNSLNQDIQYIGGISGSHGGRKHISFCTNEGNIYYHSPLYAGGITGRNYGGYIRYCKNEGVLMGSSTIQSKIGGIAGQNSSYAIMKRSYNTGIVNDSISNSGGGNDNFRRLGGICGENDSYSIIEDCYNTGNLSSLYNWGRLYFGAIAGSNSYYSFITNTFNTGIVTSTLDSTSFVYENDESAVKNSFWNTDICHIIPYMSNNSGNCVNVHGLTTTQMKDISNYTAAGWDFQNVWQIDPEINEGYPYLIWTNDPLTTDEETIPLVFSEKPLLNPAYPNPFNPSTTLSYILPKSEKVSLNIYNVKGQKVKSLLNEYQSKGHHSIIWNGKSDYNVPCGSGIYFYRLETSESSQTKKMMLVK